MNLVEGLFSERQFMSRVPDENPKFGDDHTVDRSLRRFIGSGVEEH